MSNTFVEQMSNTRKPRYYIALEHFNTSVTRVATGVILFNGSAVAYLTLSPPSILITQHSKFSIKP